MSVNLYHRLDQIFTVNQHTENFAEMAGGKIELSLFIVLFINEQLSRKCLVHGNENELKNSRFFLRYGECCFHILVPPLCLFDKFPVNLNQKLTPRGGGTPRKIGVCGPLPKTLTLFMVKICDFPYPIYNLTKNLILYL